MLDMPFRMMLLAIAGWLNEGKRVRIDFLEEQLRIFQEVHGRRPRLNNDQRRRLAAPRAHRWTEAYCASS